MQVAPCLLEGPSLYGESTLVLENIYQAQIVYGVNKAEMREYAEFFTHMRSLARMKQDSYPYSII